MPRTTHQTKAEKAEYDKERKAGERKEKRFTKPLKVFIQRKYPVIYSEFVKFFNQLENENTGKKDLTKTNTFKEFLTNYPTQEKTLTSLVETTTTSFPNLISPVEATVEVIESSTSEASTSESVPSLVEAQKPNTVSEILDEIFGPGGINEEDIQQIENNDEGIDLNIFDELSFDLEPFDIELETNIY